MPSGLSLWRTKYGLSLVLQVFFAEATAAWQDAIWKGATWDYPDFKPHLTLCYDVEPHMPGMLLYIPQNLLEFNPLEVSELEEEWKPEAL